MLSGGGARGAYEAGAVAGLMEILRPRSAPFDRFAGTSVGAMQAAYLAANAHHPDLAAPGLVALWRALRLRTHLRIERRWWRRRAALDVRPFEQIVRAHVDGPQLRHNVASGRVAALFVAALHVESGRTTVFADLAPGVDYVPTRNPHRETLRTAITADHVLASAAIPTLFPPRAIGGRLYYDGGLRYNTPLAPAIRAGADRLVVISPLYDGPAAPAPVRPADQAPDAVFLAGKMLHAVLLDPFAYDLEVLGRFNELLDTLDRALDPGARAAFDARTAALRGLPYRKLDVLALSPSADLGALGLRFLERNRRALVHEGWLGAALAAYVPRLVDSGTDLASYLLFDGRFADELTALGRQDAWDRADTVRAFFAG